jgi:transposase InsO family protein
VVHFNVTAHPTAAWTAQQLIEAFPEDSVPRYLLRDRDSIYGLALRERAQGMGIDEVLTAPHSPWQNACVERLHGSLRHECLNHVIILNERHLKHILKSYWEYYHQYRTHLALGKDTPQTRPVEPIRWGSVYARAQVSGLHHSYHRRAA